MAKTIRVVPILVALLLSTPALAVERTIRLHVDNMDCAACPVIVKQSLARVSGVYHGRGVVRAQNRVGHL